MSVGEESPGVGVCSEATLEVSQALLGAGNDVSREQLGHLGMVQQA